MKRTTAGWLAIPGGIVLLLAGCSIAPPPLECPKTWDWSRLGIAASRRDTLLSGPDSTQNIPEFHDCQRLLVRDPDQHEALVYGPVASIFAVGALERSADTLATPYADAEGEALPAAQIYTSEAYPPLGLGVGLSCLYLRAVREGEWDAAIRPDERIDADCSKSIPAEDMRGAGWTRLRVVRDPVATGNAPENFPVTARWVWNEQTATYHIGIRCDLGWCSVGSEGFQPIPSYYRAHLTGGGMGMPDLRRFDVQGWYDEQLLAQVDPSGNLVPSGIVGTVFPDINLGRYDDAAYQSHEWLHAADVALRQPPNFPGANPFESKLNLFWTPPDGPFNSVFLCNGDRTECAVPAAVPVCGDGQWWAKVDPPAGMSQPSKYGCVTRCGYSIRIPGTVRWRWLEQDPGIWMRCVNGCCELTGAE